MTQPRRVLVIGAGFAGAVHARELAERDFIVDVIDRRPHIAGNAYDEVLPDGTRIHRYGPHLFHTNNAVVMRWLSRFGEFEPYVHRVSAELPGHHYLPLPINRTTINHVFSVQLGSQEDVTEFLRKIAVPCERPESAADYLYSRIGRTLTDLFFRPYSKKMWALDLEEMHESVVRRVSLRPDDDDRYFPDDDYQVLPKHGYTALVARIFDHPSIRVQTGQAYQKGMECGYSTCFNSMPIDEYFDSCFGPLPYRSIRFHHRSEPADYSRGPTAVVNFTDTRLYTRETDWAVLPSHRLEDRPHKTVTLEEPCDYAENAMERYYPVRTNDDRHKRTYDRYLALAASNPRMRFIGRCGTYQYLDMDQVINQSLQHVRRVMPQLD